ncbi:DUF4876 domain-containing protein [Chitinophaga lutea]
MCLRYVRLCFVLFAGIALMTACKKDDLSIKTSTVGVTLTVPNGLANAQASNLVVAFKEINSGATDTFRVATTAGLANLRLPDGSYQVTIEGDISYGETAEEKVTGKIRGYKEGVLVSGGSVTVDIPLFLHSEKDGLVLKEVFFTGTVTPEGKQYNGDKYFIIYNNSEDTLYADGLVISEAAFLSTTKRVYTPDVMKDAFTAGTVVMIPGAGKQYPINPGKQIVIANNAVNHKELNVNSLDLRAAEFELTLLSSIDVDNPQVPDLVNVTGFMTMHNRGFKSYVLARFPAGVTTESFLKDNFYQYTYTNTDGTPSRAQNGYKIPNAWIEDAVNLSTQGSFEWILTDPSIDMGWTYCGTGDSDDKRFGKAVRRKVLSTNPDGRVILKDTNNSTKDFDAEVKPSLMP